MTVLNEKQRELIGTWRHESAENSDEFLKKIGINFVLRKVAALQKPIVRIQLNDDDTWSIFIESAFKNHDWKITKFGKRLLHTTIDGRTFWLTTTIEPDGTQTDVQERHEKEPKNIPSITKRYVENGKLIIVEECDGVISRRVFTRVEE
ncbi:FABP domain-containing protein [Aphelenchoides besseyi]|nr:FABP domain-containing protein [Aphelenchoides besseyi]KAI6208503.1 FABP domain-containing protein [Aphelenchoides besseyi]